MFFFILMIIIIITIENITEQLEDLQATLTTRAVKRPQNEKNTRRFFFKWPHAMRLEVMRADFVQFRFRLMCVSFAPLSIQTRKRFFRIYFP